LSIFNKNPDIGNKKKTHQRISMTQQLSAKAANFQDFLSSRGIEGRECSFIDRYKFTLIFSEYLRSS